MIYRYHVLGQEDPFIWQEHEEQEADEFEKLFQLEVEQPAIQIGDLASRYLGAHVAEAQRDVHQIRDEIVSRRRLMDRQIKELDYQVSHASWSLKQLYFRVGYNAAVDFKRNWTERELANFRRERRNLRLRCWEDIVALRKELREAERQYDDVKVRSGILEGDDDGN